MLNLGSGASGWRLILILPDFLVCVALKGIIFFKPSGIPHLMGYTWESLILVLFVL